MTLSSHGRLRVRGLRPSPERALARNSGGNHLRTLSLELVVHAHGYAHRMAFISAPGGRAGAAVIIDPRIRAVVAIRRQCPAAGAQIVVGIAVIDGIRN